MKGNSAEKLEKAYAECLDLAAHRDFVAAVEAGDLAAAARMVYGGTYMEAAVNYMLEKGIDTDYAVFLTDTEEYGSGWLKAWKNYHKRHPKAVAFVLRGDSYMTSPVSESEAEKLNVYQVFGWDDSVIDYMKFVLEKRKEKQLV